MQPPSKPMTPDEKATLINRFKQDLLPFLTTVETELGIAHSEKKLERPDGPAWLAAAIEAISTVARQQELLTADDIWGVMGEDTEYQSQMGIAFRQAKKLGYIVYEGAWRESVRPTQHRSAVRVWRSLVKR